MAPGALLHVTNGDSAGGTLQQTRLGGEVLSWKDVLHEGPVPSVPRRELLRVRAAFLSECGWGDAEAIASSLEQRDSQFVRALRDGAHVVLWFEHDLFDQLQLVDALALARENDASPELIVVGSFPGRPAFRGLGELDAAELETLWPERRGASAEALETAAAVWDAFRAPEPSGLATWAARDLGELPFLAAALQRLLEELPAPVDGLSGTERRALQAIAAGARTPLDAFVTAQDLEPAPFLGDAWFFRTLAALAHGRNGLIEMEGGESLSPVRLTPVGERVLRGEADRVELLGIDRWIGGTHVTEQNLWRWDPAERVLVP